MDQNRIIKVVDDNGNEKEMYIIFLTNLEKYNKDYIFYTDPSDENGQVFVSSFDDKHNLSPIEKDEEWADLEEVFNQFIEDSKNNQCQGCTGNCDDCGEECDCDGDCSCNK